MTGFYIAGIALVAWAAILTTLGVRRENFPSTPTATRIVGAISVVLVLTTIGLAIYLSATEEEDESGGGEEAAALVSGLP